jgi:hypothetical protein
LTNKTPDHQCPARQRNALLTDNSVSSWHLPKQPMEATDQQADELLKQKLKQRKTVMHWQQFLRKKRTSKEKVPSYSTCT